MPKPNKSAIVRWQSIEKIKCSSTRMKKFVCMPKGDLRRLYKACLKENEPFYYFW